MVNEHDQIQSGQIKFLSAAPPPLVAGEYAIRATQQVNIPAEKNKDGKATGFSNDATEFWVGAPRFALNTEDIYSVYPAAGSIGSYYYSLPHIVLNRKTLPWERTIDGSVPGPDEVKPPWMALLLLDEEEIAEHDISLKTVLLKEIFPPAQSGGTLIYPRIAPEPPDIEEMESAAKDENNALRYTVIDVPLSLLRDIIPYNEELPYLAHARQVDTGNKAAEATNAKGWFSSLICNRLPAKGKTSSVFLVSLEGQGAYLQPNSPGAPDSLVRMVVLYRWSFEAKGLDFEKLVNNLNDGAAPYRIVVDAPISNQAVKDALHYGYTALNQQFREGSRSISWYRGPLVPANIAKPPNYMFSAADGALRFDAESGMFDVSYGAAWQLGRLLALENPGFSEAINNWKNGFVKDFRMDIARQLLKKEFKDSIDFSVSDDTQTITPEGKLRFSEALYKMEADELMKNLLLEIWHQNIG